MVTSTTIGGQQQQQQQQQGRGEEEEVVPPSPIVVGLSNLAGVSSLLEHAHKSVSIIALGGVPGATGERDGSPSESTAIAAKPGRQPGARFALAVLTCINLLNYIDRYVPSAVKDLIKADLDLTDSETSYPLTGMILVYMVASPFFGWLSDHRIVGRRPLLTAAVVFWSAATALASLSNNLASLVGLRSLVGVGEACYVVIATPMIADFFPSKERNVALGIFYLAIPVGAALGYALGGSLGQAFGWRAAFLFCGIPGLVVALLVLMISDPQHGINDDPHTKEEAAAAKGRSQLDDYKLIFSNPYFNLALGGVTANTFCLGALADWMPTFLSRYRGMGLQSAGLVIGIATVVGGTGGLFLGASLSDHYQRKGLKNAYFIIPAIFCLPAAALVWMALNIDSRAGSSLLFLISEVFVWTYNSPISVIMVNCLRPELRARGIGAQIFVQHILGDVISPPIIGGISDATGSLLTAVNILPAFAVISFLFWMYAGLKLPELPSLERKEGEEEEHVSFYRVLCAREEEGKGSKGEEVSSAAAGGGGGGERDSMEAGGGNVELISPSTVRSHSVASPRSSIDDDERGRGGKRKL